MVAGSYHTVSYLVNSLRLPLEAGAARFGDIESRVGPGTGEESSAQC